MKNTILHTIKLPERTLTLEVVEEETRIVCRLRCSKYGDFGDQPQFSAWMAEILEPYNSDSRPIQLSNPITGESALIIGDGKGACVLIQQPNS